MDLGSSGLELNELINRGWVDIPLRGRNILGETRHDREEKSGGILKDVKVGEGMKL